MGCTAVSVPALTSPDALVAASSDAPVASLVPSPPPPVVTSATPPVVHQAPIAPAPTVAGACGDTVDVYTWIDTDADGQRDATEAPLHAVTIIVIDTVARRITRTQRTDADGHLALFAPIGGCPTARFEVVADVPASYRLTTPDTVTSRYPEADGAITFGYVALPGGSAAALPLTALDRIATCGWIGATMVYEDHDGNGRMDGVDTPLAAITVAAHDTVRTLTYATVTDHTGTAGWYELFDVTGTDDCGNARFVVSVQVPPGFRSTTPERVASAYPGIQPDSRFDFGFQRTP